MAQYLKPDSELGYIEEQAEIESLKINNLRHTILGCMLGDFDETGAYVVQPDIVQELIEMPKYIVESLDNIEICKGVLKLDKQVVFMVTFEGNKATLSLVEKLSYEANFAINSGTYSNVNEYILDSVETSGEINRNVIYDRWHIANNEGNVIDIFNCDEETLAKYFGVVNRFKYLLHANKILLEKEEQIEEIESSYSNEIFEALKHYPKFYEAVMKQIQETLNEKPGAISVGKPNFAKTFNELLENAVQSNIGILNEKEQIEFNAEKRNALVNLNIKRAEVFEIDNVQGVNSDSDLSQKIIKLKTDNSYLSKSVNELAEEMLTAHKDLQTKKGENNQIEVGQLISFLASSGIDEQIGLKKPEKVETANNVNATTPVAPRTTNNVNGKRGVVGGGNTQRSGTTARGNVKKGTGGKQGRNAGQQRRAPSGRTVEGQQTIIPRLLHGMIVGQYSENNTDTTKINPSLLDILNAARDGVGVRDSKQIGVGRTTGQRTRTTGNDSVHNLDGEAVDSRRVNL